MTKRAIGIGVFLLGLAVTPCVIRPQPLWSATELTQLRSLWIGSLPAVPPDPSNRVADDAQAAEFGRKLFFDSRLSANGYVSCATCHRPNRAFQDGLPLGKGVRLTKRRTQALVDVAYSPFLSWDGRKDSPWAQALGALEGPSEHDGHRFTYARTIADFYAAEYESIFGPMPALDWTARWAQMTAGEQAAVTRVFVNMGKAVEAYERTLLPKPTRFDAYVEAVLNGDRAGPDALTTDEVAGLKLFIGKAACVRCHNTPLFTDHQPHNTGVPPANWTDGKVPDRGWADGLPLMLEDEFGCTGRWSDAQSDECADRRPLVAALENQVGAFKTPSLRGVASRPPYMHAGQCATLEDVLNHYRTAPTATIGKSEIQARNLGGEEMRQLIAFLKTLGD